MLIQNLHPFLSCVNESNTNINIFLVTFLKWKLVLLVKDLEEFGTWHGHWVFRTINVQLS